MIAKFLAVLCVAGAALGAARNFPLAGVDPNTLACSDVRGINLLLPHFTDCSKFVQCVHGEEVEMSCAPGTIFVFDIQVCDHKWAAECQLRTDPNAEDVEGSGEGEWEADVEGASAPVVDADAATLSGTLFQAVINCDSADSASRQVAYRGDCQRYWRCVNGLPVTFYCSDGLFFNEKTMQCDHEGNVQCQVTSEDELANEFIVYKQ